jgi:hypothetical protein
MQNQLLMENPATKIRILGVNDAGHERGNTAMTSGRTLPWLQDTAADAVWTSWAVTNRDLVILDAANVKRDVYNLTSNDLADPVNYDELKARLKIVAGEP